MGEAEGLLEVACAAMAQGDPEACRKALESFAAEVGR